MVAVCYIQQAPPSPHAKKNPSVPLMISMTIVWTSRRCSRKVNCLRPMHRIGYLQAELSDQEARGQYFVPPDFIMSCHSFSQIGAHTDNHITQKLNKKTPSWW